MPQFRWAQLFAAVAVGVIAGLLGWTLLVRLVPVLLIAGTGFAIAYLLDPALEHLTRRGWSRGLAVGAFAFLLLGLLALTVILVAPALVGQVTSLAQSLPLYTEDLTKATGPGSKLFVMLQAHFPNLSNSAYLQQQLDTAREWLTGKLPTALSWVSGTLLSSFRAVGVTLITLIVAVWFMLVMHPFRERFEALFSEGEATQLRSMDRQISTMLGQYLRGMAITCFLIALTNAVLLTVVGQVLGTSYGLLIAAVAGLAYLVPYLGMLTAVVLAGLLSYLTAAHDPWIAAALSVGVVLVVNQVFDSLVMPRIVGRKVGLHPLAIILAMLAGAALFGIWGMVLATPIAAAIKIMLAHWVPVIAPPAVEEGPAPARPAPLALDLGAFAAQSWKTLRSAGHRLEDLTSPLTHHETHSNTTPPTEEFTDDDPGT